MRIVIDDKEAQSIEVDADHDEFSRDAPSPVSQRRKV
jgi:hypothetical protein